MSSRLLDPSPFTDVRLRLSAGNLTVATILGRRRTATKAAINLRFRVTDLAVTQLLRGVAGSH
jgi:hypothetical protein